MEIKSLLVFDSNLSKNLKFTHDTSPKIIRHIYLFKNYFYVVYQLFKDVGFRLLSLIKLFYQNFIISVSLEQNLMVELYKMNGDKWYDITRERSLETFLRNFKKSTEIKWEFSLEK